MYLCAFAKEPCDHCWCLCHQSPIIQQQSHNDFAKICIVSPLTPFFLGEEVDIGLAVLSHCIALLCTRKGIEWMGRRVVYLNGQGARNNTTTRTLIILRQDNIVVEWLVGADSAPEIVSSPEKWSWHMHQSWINSVQRHTRNNNTDWQREIDKL